MRHSRAFTMNSKGVVERPHRQKRSLGATIQRSAHRAFAEVRRTSGMCQELPLQIGGLRRFSATEDNAGIVGRHPLKPASTWVSANHRRLGLLDPEQ
jgi:hypothetical protein